MALCTSICGGWKANLHSTINFSGQRAIEPAAAVHVLTRLPLRDLSDGADIVSWHRLPLAGIEPHRNPKLLHHLHFILIHQIAILIAVIVASDGILLLLLILRNGVVLVFILLLWNDVVLVALTRRRGRGAGAGPLVAVAEAMPVPFVRRASSGPRVPGSSAVGRART